MFKEILPKLRCPICGSELSVSGQVMEGEEIITGQVTCQNKHDWPISEGVLNLLFQDTEGKPQSYEGNRYDLIDAEMMNSVPEGQKQGYGLCMRRMLDEIKFSYDRHVLDIGTGRGMFLVEFLKCFGNEITLTCIDLSFEALKYARIKSLLINPDIRYNYIACNVRNMPFINNVFDHSTSFIGIANMGEGMADGIKEGVRVAKKGLLDLAIIVKDENEKIDQYPRYLAQLKQTEYIKLHQYDNSHAVLKENIFSGIGESSNNADLLPVEGEWYAMQLIQVMKK